MWPAIEGQSIGRIAPFEPQLPHYRRERGRFSSRPVGGCSGQTPSRRWAVFRTPCGHEASSGAEAHKAKPRQRVDLAGCFVVAGVDLNPRPSGESVRLSPSALRIRARSDCSATVGRDQRSSPLMCSALLSAKVPAADLQATPIWIAIADTCRPSTTAWATPASLIPSTPTAADLSLLAITQITVQRTVRHCSRTNPSPQKYD